MTCALKNRGEFKQQVIVQDGEKQLYANTVEVLKYAQCIRLAGPMHYFPHHCFKGTNGMSDSHSTLTQEREKRPYYGPTNPITDKKDIDPEFLRRTFSYNPDTGIFTKKPWIGSRGRVTKEIVYGLDGVTRYVQIPVGGKMFLAHRLVFVFMFGIYPELQVDHIDGNGRNNKLENLRLVTHKQNAQHNVNGNSNNTTGFRGVYRSRRGLWRSSIQVDGVHRHIGVFDTKEAAHAAYLSAKNEVHFQ